MVGVFGGVPFNRTAVYARLTPAFAATYFAGVVVPQAALFVLALFAPLRRRIQAAADQRFSVPATTPSARSTPFGARLRDEVDFVDVRVDLVGVVGDTLRPMHVSLWLREARR